MMGALLMDLTQKLFPDEVMDCDEHSRMEQIKEKEEGEEEEPYMKMDMRRARRKNMKRAHARMEK